jgi:hypothetical protein
MVIRQRMRAMTPPLHPDLSRAICHPFAVFHGGLADPHHCRFHLQSTYVSPCPTRRLFSPLLPRGDDVIASSILPGRFE